MKNLLYRLIGLKSNQNRSILLFDSLNAASDIAFMIGGDWDGCNGVEIDKPDKIAVNTAANLIETKWCFAGATQAILDRLTTNELLNRYAVGDRHFINANLRCGELSSLNLADINLSYAKLNFANLNQTNLSKADLTSSDITQANLSDCNLSQSTLIRANLQNTNLSRANLRGANLNYACLDNANLSEADLRDAKLTFTDLKTANLDGAVFS